MQNKKIFSKISLKQEIECLISYHLTEEKADIIRKKFGLGGTSPIPFTKIAKETHKKPQAIEAKRFAGNNKIRRVMRKDKSRPLLLFLDALDELLEKESSYGFMEVQRFFEIVFEEFNLTEADYPYLVYTLDVAANIRIDRVHIKSLNQGGILVRFVDINLQTISNTLVEFYDFFRNNNLNNLLKETDAKKIMKSQGLEWGYFLNCLSILDYFIIEHGFITKNYPAAADSLWYINQVLWNAKSPMNYRQITNQIYADYQVIKEPAAVLDALGKRIQYKKVNIMYPKNRTDK